MVVVLVVVKDLEGMKAVGVAATEAEVATAVVGILEAVLAVEAVVEEGAVVDAEHAGVNMAVAMAVAETVVEMVAEREAVGVAVVRVGDGGWWWQRGSRWRGWGRRGGAELAVVWEVVKAAVEMGVGREEGLVAVAPVAVKVGGTVEAEKVAVMVAAWVVEKVVVARGGARGGGG